MADDFACGVHHFAGRFLGAAVAVDEADVILIGNKTDFLAVFFLGRLDAHPPGHFAEIAFVGFADGEDDFREQFPADSKQHVGLVLRQILAADQSGLVFACDRNQPRIMSGGDSLGPDLASEVPELAELEPVVAHHAGVGRAAGEVFIGEVIFDPAESILKVQSMKRNIQGIGDAAGIGGIGCAATTLLVAFRIDDGERIVRRRARRLFVDAGPHKQPDDLVTLLFEKIRRRGTVHAAAHRQHDTHFD